MLPSRFWPHLHDIDQQAYCVQDQSRAVNQQFFLFCPQAVSISGCGSLLRFQYVANRQHIDLNDHLVDYFDRFGDIFQLISYLIKYINKEFKLYNKDYANMKQLDLFEDQAIDSAESKPTVLPKKNTATNDAEQPAFAATENNPSSDRKSVV